MKQNSIILMARVTGLVIAVMGKQLLLAQDSHESGAEKAKKLVEAGDLLRKKGDMLGAIDRYGKAIELDRKCIEAYVHRAEVSEQQKKYSRAIDDYTQALDLDDSDPFVRRSRALAFTLNVQYDKALADYDKILEDFGGGRIQFDALLGKAVVYDKQREYRKVVDNCTRAIDADPDSPALATAYTIRARGYAGVGEVEKAKDDLRKVKELMKPKNP